ncbi:hypothetical protein BGW38_003983 [Lunasporangiospora selenospora]|uniref:F-box domain-containing protein n=1 Tax=Lunasporangiospora selenospora TaxID=979761 RepID=A0A9P6FQS4_9FUNG|nr:hypothetical protein BGW38_003983 [Lunasporangiospora selenospora]
MPKRANDSFENNPRKLHSPKSVNIIVDATTSTPSPFTHHHSARIASDAVLQIPELVEGIGRYLCTKDVLALIRTNRFWNMAWIPFLYPSQTIQCYRKSSPSLIIEKYGQHIRTMDLSKCKARDILHLLDYTPHLVGLSIGACSLSFKELEPILISAAPKLRTFHFQVFSGPSDYSTKALALAAHLTNLEELSWQDQLSKIHVKDIMTVLQSCRRLRSLALHDMVLVEETPEPEPKEATEPDQDQERDTWTNTTLETLELSGVQRGMLNLEKASSADDTHSCFGQLFGRIPKISTIHFKGSDGLSPLDWDYIFRKCSLVRHVTIQIRSLFQIASPGAMEAINRYCSNVKTLQYNSNSPSSDHLFAQLVGRNSELQTISVESSNFGDLAIKNLLPRPLKDNPSRPIPNAFRNEFLTELNLRHCVHVTDQGARLLLEKCSRLCYLYLRGSNAGSIELFESSQSWACVATLCKLSIDLHPRNYVLRYNSLRIIEGDHLSIPVQYQPAEEATIRKKLAALVALKELHLSGRALTSGIVSDLPDSGLDLISLGYMAYGFLRRPSNMDLQPFQKWSRSPVQVRSSVYGKINVVVLRRRPPEY